MATSEYGQDEYVAKQKESEERENKEIVSGIIEQINKVYAPYADDKEKKARSLRNSRRFLSLTGSPA